MPYMHVIDCRVVVERQSFTFCCYLMPGLQRSGRYGESSHTLTSHNHSVAMAAWPIRSMGDSTGTTHWHLLWLADTFWFKTLFAAALSAR